MYYLSVKSFTRRFFESLFPSVLLFIFLHPLQVSGQVINPSTDEPALWLRFVQLKDVWEHVLDLFNQSPYQSPAQAVAAAKASGISPSGGNKTIEAALSLFNPDMATNLGSLEKSVFSLEPNFLNKSIDWRFGVLNDDGTFDAIVTALALDQSMTEPGFAGRTIERLGPNLVVAKSKNEIYFGPDLKMIHQVISSQSDARIADLQSPLKSGLWLRANPRKWPASLGRNMQEFIALQALKRFSAGSDVELRIFPWGESIQAECIDFLRDVPVSPVQPSWLDRWEPALRGRIMAQVSFGLNPRKPFWNQFFKIATELERSIPGREKVASLRDRLNLAALLAKVSPETDLYPNLVGLTVGAVTPDDPRVPPTIVATLHTRDIKSTQTLVEKVVVPVVRTLGSDPQTPKQLQLKPRTDGNIRGLSIVQGRPMYLFIDGTDVCLIWGARNVAEAVVKQKLTSSDGQTVAGKWLGQFAKAGPVHRVASIYPESIVRWRVMLGEIPTLWTDSISGTPPIVWLGRTQAGASRDIIAYSGSRQFVNQLLARIPEQKALKTP